MLEGAESDAQAPFLFWLYRRCGSFDGIRQPFLLAYLWLGSDYNRSCSGLGSLHIDGKGNALNIPTGDRNCRTVRTVNSVVHLDHHTLWIPDVNYRGRSRWIIRRRWRKRLIRNLGIHQMPARADDQNVGIVLCSGIEYQRAPRAPDESNDR